MKPPPDFVIVGSPKCGTTSLYAMLKCHPDVFVPDLKEPHYFSSDYPIRRRMEVIRTLEDYDHLYSKAKYGQLRGEASVLYLRSKVAVSSILDRRPDAKVIAIVRDPKALFLSWHNQCLRALDEDVEDPELAWKLQSDRTSGRNVPKFCTEPAFLQYKEFCGLGSQIGRFIETVPERQRLIVRYSTLRSSPGTFSDQVTTFLGIAPAKFVAFPLENRSGVLKHKAIARLIRAWQVDPILREIRYHSKPLVSALGLHPLGWLAKSNIRLVARPKISNAFDRELNVAFADDVHALKNILDSGVEMSEQGLTG